MPPTPCERSQISEMRLKIEEIFLRPNFAIVRVKQIIRLYLVMIKKDVLDRDLECRRVQNPAIGL